MATTFRPVSPGTYAVEVRKGRHGHSTLGRVMHAGDRRWAALGLTARAWTDWHSTRAAAVASMLAGDTFLSAGDRR